MDKSDVAVASRRATLEDVLQRVLNSAELTPKQRADMASALRTVGRLKGQPLSSFDGNVVETRKLLADILPARHRLSVGRWANIRSLVMRSLWVGGALQRSRTKLTVSWSKLLQPLPYKPYRLCLLPFGRFCSRCDIAPTDVTSETFNAYLTELETFSLRSRPREIYLSVCRSWNSAAQNFEHWPSFIVVPDDRRQWYALPWSDFPASLKTEVDAMIEEASNPDPLSSTPHKPIRPATARGRARAIRAFASALVHRGVKPEALKSIASIVEPEIAKEGLRFFIEHTGKKRSAYLRDFARLLVTLTRHWVYPSVSELSDDQQRTRDAAILRLEGIRKALDVPRSGMTPKNRATLRNLGDDDILQRLLTLPERVWRRYKNLPDLKRTDLIKLQVALAIEILTVAPIRRKNLVRIRLDQNLIVNGSGPGRRVYLYFASADVKNSVELEFELPRSTANLLDRYLNEVRPRLIGGSSVHLFPGSNGSFKCDYLFSNQIATLTAAEVGVRITAHQFRHIAGFLYLKANPGGHEVVRRLLGHKSINTTLEFYSAMQASEAFRHYDRIIAEHRAQDLASRSPKGGRVVGGPHAR